MKRGVNDVKRATKCSGEPSGSPLVPSERGLPSKPLPSSPLDFISRGQTGEFGNVPKAWVCYDEFRRAWEELQLPEEVWVAHKTPGHPFRIYNANTVDLVLKRTEYVKGERGSVGRLCDCYFVSLPPCDNNRLFQFRLAFTASGCEMLADFEQGCDVPLGKRIREGRTVPILDYATIQLVLHSYLDVDDYDSLVELCQRFPNVVIEATMFERPFGLLDRRLVIWEVRGGTY